MLELDFVVCFVSLRIISSFALIFHYLPDWSANDFDKMVRQVITCKLVIIISCFFPLIYE